MAKEATRERKLAFINRFGRNALRVLTTEAICIYGDDFLTDEQIDLLTSMQVENERERNRRNIENRALRAALEEVA